VECQERISSYSDDEGPGSPCSMDDLEVFDELELTCEKDLNLFKKRPISYKKSKLADHSSIDKCSAKADQANNNSV